MAGKAKVDDTAPEEGSPMPEPTFPNVGEPDDGAGGEEGGAKSVEEQLAEMQAAQEEERRKFEEERQAWQSRFDRLLQGQQAAPQAPAPAPEPQPPAPPNLDLSGLPDPVDKPQEYHAALQQRMATALQEQAKHLDQAWQQRQQQTSQELSTSQRFDRMWQQFQKDYSDLAEKEATLNGAIQAEVNGLKARGLDPQRAIFADEQGFMQNVAERMRKELGTPPPDGGTQQPPPNRTQGLGTGSQQKGSGSSGEGKYPGFNSQLKKAQLDSGLI